MIWKLSLLVAASAVLLSSCSTMAGFGRDVQHAGGKIEEKAQR